MYDKRISTEKLEDGCENCGFHDGIEVTEYPHGSMNDFSMWLCVPCASNILSGSYEQNTILWGINYLAKLIEKKL